MFILEPSQMLYVNTCKLFCIAMSLKKICLTILFLLLYRSYIRFFFQKIPYILICIFASVIAAALLIKFDHFDEKAYIQTRRQRFLFYKRSNWNKSLEYLEQKRDSKENRQIYSDNFIINDTLNNLITLILRDFVENWFQRISADQSFINSIRHEFKFIVQNLQNRLVEIDFANLIVHNLIPILNEHVDAFIAAQEITKNKKVINKSSNPVDKPTDINDDSILASNYKKGLLHKGIQLHFSDSNYCVKRYLSNLVNRILPYLLEPTEVNCVPVAIMIRELVSGCVLNPICLIFTDPDFYNQMIVSTLSKQIKDRNDVKKLRSILRRHSMTNLSLNEDAENDILSYSLSPKTPKSDFDALLKVIGNATDSKSLLKYKYFTILQHNKTLELIPKKQIEESKSVQRYLKRLNIILDLLDSKLNENDNESTTENESIVTEKSHALAALSTDISLHQILTSSTKLKYFSNYMASRGDRHILLDFWLSVETLRNPLEFNFCKASRNIINSTNEDDEESSDDETTLLIDDDCSQADNIKEIFDKYFHYSVMKVPPKIFYKVSEFLEGASTDKLAYLRARKCVLKLQDIEYSRLKQSDFVAFRNSDEWLKLLVEEAVNVNGSSSNRLDAAPDLVMRKGGLIKDRVDLKKFYGDPLATYSEKEKDTNYVDVNMTGKVSEKVVKAVEDALSEIMNASQEKTSFNLMNTNEKRISRLVSDDVAKDIFGADDNQESLFAESDTDSVSNDISSSTDDLLASRYDSSNTLHLESNLGEPHLNFINPSSLNLSKEIERLDVEIEKLQQQRLILQTLLKKAEIINNVPELRILRKSLLSLEKELKLKSVQKEQYVVQDGEASLYENSKVTISDYIYSKDKNGKDFVMYMIKVVKLSPEDHATPIANWMITRRFSQFYELHNYLKARYPSVSEMDFPKKQMIIKFRQFSFIEERQRKLRVYLQTLIKNKDICSDRIFRDFLSSENFDVQSNEKMVHGGYERPKNNDGSGTKLYNIISSQALYPILSLTNYRGINDQIDDDKLVLDKNIEDSQTFDSDENSAPQEKDAKDATFVQPICDLLISVFQLNSSTSWLRGKAMILLFQQLFGSTVEKVIRVNIDGKLKSEETVSTILMGMLGKLWPNGNFKKNKIARSEIEKDRSKQQCKLLLHIFLTDIASKLFGQNAVNQAADTIFFMLQNEILNRHLVLTILDEIFASVFPEILEQNK